MFFVHILLRITSIEREYAVALWKDGGKMQYGGDAGTQVLPPPYSKMSRTARRVMDLLLQREIARDLGDEDAVRWMEEELRTIRSQDPDAFVEGAEKAYMIIGYAERFAESVAQETAGR